MRKTKVLIVALIFSLVFSLSLAGVTSAYTGEVNTTQNNFVITSDNVQGIAGNEYDVVFSISENSNVCSFNFTLMYDKSIHNVIGVSVNEMLSGDFLANYSEEGLVRIAYISTENITAATALFTLKITINQTAIRGDKCKFDINYDEEIKFLTQGSYEPLRNYFFKLGIVRAGVFGDVDGDGDVKVYDLIYMQRYLVKLSTFDEGQLKDADINCDGTVDLIDCQYVKDYLAGLIDTLVIEQQEIIFYTVTFIDFDGNVFDEQSVKEGEGVIIPQPPYIDGYTFIGYNCSNEELSAIYSDMTVYAQYKENQVNFYTLTLIDLDGNIIDIQTIDEGWQIYLPDAPLINGYVFDGWFTSENEQYYGGEYIQNDLTLYAVYSEHQGIIYGEFIDNIETYTDAVFDEQNLTFTYTKHTQMSMTYGSDENGNIYFYNSMMYIVNNSLYETEEPGSILLTVDNISEYYDIELTAYVKNSVSIVYFYENYFTAEWSDSNYENCYMIDEQGNKIVERDGNKYIINYNDDGSFYFEIYQNNDEITYGSLMIESQTYDATFNESDFTYTCNVNCHIEMTYGFDNNGTIYLGEYSFYVLDNNFYFENVEGSELLTMNNILSYCNNQYSIFFEDSEKTVYLYEIYFSATWQDYFEGTYTLDDNNNIIIEIYQQQFYVRYNENNEIYLEPVQSQTQQYTVTFYDNEGNLLSTQTIFAGGKIFFPEAPIYEGLIFEGWYYEGEEFYFDYPVYSDMEIYAVYTEDMEIEYGSLMEENESYDFTFYEDFTFDCTFTGYFEMSYGIDKNNTLYFFDTPMYVLDNALYFTEETGATLLTLDNISNYFDIEFSITFEGFLFTGNLYETYFSASIQADESGTYIIDENDRKIVTIDFIEYYVCYDENNNVYLEEIESYYTYTVTFIDEDGTILDVITVNEGDIAFFPIEPREGYNFVGWITENGDFYDYYPVYNDLTLLAKWEELIIA